MELYQAGNLAKSLAGHDKDKIYMIIRKEKEQVYLADGEIRPVEKPKRKSKKHIQPIYQKEGSGYDEKRSRTEQNEAIKRAIRQYQKAAEEQRNL